MASLPNPTPISKRRRDDDDDDDGQDNDRNREAPQRKLRKTLGVRRRSVDEAKTTEPPPGTLKLRRSPRIQRLQHDQAEADFRPTRASLCNRVTGQEQANPEPLSSRHRSANSASKSARVAEGDHFFDDEAIPGKRTTARSVESLTANFYIDQWLTQSSWSRNQPVGVDMPPRPSALPSPSDSFDRTTSSSRKSDRSTASVHDSDYRSSLRHRNIYINRDDPPKHLLQHAQRIIARPRASPEMDDEAVRRIIKVGKAMEEEAEDVMVQQFASDIIPAMKRIPDARLTANANQAWTNCVPLPLDTTILTRPPALPRPKPDVAFGYSREAFTRPQLGTIGLLVDDHYGRSYAVPDQKLHFPFLDIEFKSQAKSGTHYVATNQAAGAGALALQGRLDLFERSGMLEAFDYDAPQFFSVTMDHELARINVHWLQRPAGRQPTFHVEGLSKHLLDDADGIRAVARAIKNILDDAADTRLQKLCEALDAYRKVIVRERGAASTDATPGNPHSTPEQNEGDIDIRTLQPASPPSSPHTRSKMRQARPDADCTSYSRLGRASGDAAVSVHARTRLRGDRSARHVADPTGPASPVLPDPPKAISHSRHADTGSTTRKSTRLMEQVQVDMKISKRKRHRGTK